MNFRKFFCILTMAALFVVSFAGCAYNPKTVVTVDGTEISSGVYLYYQYTATDQAYDNYAESLGEDETITKYQFVNKLNKLEIEGITAKEWIETQTVKAIKEHVFIENEFRRLNLELSASAQYFYSQEYSNAWSSMGSVYQTNGISSTSFSDCIYNKYKKAAVNTALYDEGGEFEIPFPDLEAFFPAHYTRMDYLVVPATDATYGQSVTSGDFETITKIAQKMVDAVNETGDLKAAFLKYFSEIATILNDERDPETIYESYYTADAVVNEFGTSPNALLLEELFSASAPGKSDQYVLFTHFANETGQNYAILIYKINGLSDEDSYKDYESSLRVQISKDPFEDYIVASTVNYTIEFNNRARRYYSPSKVRLA